MVPAYDPEARRRTPLAEALAVRIRQSGPMTVADYMKACLADPEHGYYRTRNAIGAGGDFITAPEISQTFGELIGLWSAVVWQQMGAPARVNLIEVGPGRGSMMIDMLRASRSVQGFSAALQVTFVEPSPVLAAAQKSRLAATGVTARWVTHMHEIEPAPSIVIGNELLDCLPVAQFVRAEIGWIERGVGLDARGELAYCRLDERPALVPGKGASAAHPGAIHERRDFKETGFLLTRLADGAPLAALFVDYGYTGGEMGETLQAVRRHAYEHPLTSPGEADLTAHVDFAAFARAMRGWGFAVDGPVTQAEFLGALGIAERASQLIGANPSRAGAIEAGIARLMAPTGMGTRFKAVGLRSPDVPPLPGFPPMDSAGPGP